jgi:hypothetical protein
VITSPHDSTSTRMMQTAARPGRLCIDNTM